MAASPCIRKCNDRLERATDALSRLESSSNLKDAERAWSEFLIAASTIYSALEQGSKSVNGKALAWFGRIKKERKDEALLSYLHHARNSDEHGIEEITRRDDTTPILYPVGLSPEGYREFRVDELPVPSIQLTTVTDSRYGDSFDPPGWFFGECIIDFSPAGVARLGLGYLRALVLSAEEMGF